MERIEKMESMKLIIATPFYEVKAYSPYIMSLLGSVKALNAINIDWEYSEHSGDSYVDRAKNIMAKRFMDSDATHLFMIDSDLHWDVEGFLRVVMAAKAGFDVVGGTFPNKNNWDSFGVVMKKDEEGCHIGYEKGNMRLLEATAMPGGFLIYSRKAFEITQPLLKRYKLADVDRDGVPTGKEVDYYEYFCTNVVDIGEVTTKVGEDVYFQRKYMETGGKLWIEPRIKFQHWGVKGWHGNYHEHLIRQMKVAAANGIEQPEGAQIHEETVV